MRSLRVALVLVVGFLVFSPDLWADTSDRGVVPLRMGERATLEGGRFFLEVTALYPGKVAAEVEVASPVGDTASSSLRCEVTPLRREWLVTWWDRYGASYSTFLTFPDSGGRMLLEGLDVGATVFLGNLSPNHPHAPSAAWLGGEGFGVGFASLSDGTSGFYAGRMLRGEGGWYLVPPLVPLAGEDISSPGSGFHRYRFTITDEDRMALGAWPIGGKTRYTVTYSLVEWSLGVVR